MRGIDWLTTMQDYEDILAITKKQKRKPVAKATNSGNPLSRSKACTCCGWSGMIYRGKRAIAYSLVKKVGSILG